MTIAQLLIKLCVFIPRKVESVQVTFAPLTLAMRSLQADVAYQATDDEDQNGEEGLCHGSSSSRSAQVHLENTPHHASCL